MEKEVFEIWYNIVLLLNHINYMNNVRDLFFENKRILIERNISAGIISQLEEEKIISYKDDFVLFVMKDLQGNI